MKPCKLILSLDGLLSTESNYIQFLSENSNSKSCRQLINIIQNHIMKIETPDEEKSCISDSLKLIEHFMIISAEKELDIKLKGRQRTLSQIIKKLDKLFPSISAALCKKYELCIK